MATTWIKPLHVGKDRTVATALGIAVDYVDNPNKTERGEWVTSYECDPLIADDEFMFSKNRYAVITGRDQREKNVIAYHLRISFAPGETDAATANRIGYELAMKLTKGNHAFVCCTHTDRVHIHSHIAINSTNLDCTKKFRNFKNSSFAVRRIADHLCLENGLSIVENPKPSRGSYTNWRGDVKPLTNRERLEQIIDVTLENCKDYGAFIAALITAGCEVKQNKNLSIKVPGAERFVRCSSLGADYTEEAILERISGKRFVTPKPKVTVVETFMPFVITGHTKFGLLIDIQKKIQEGKGEAYEQWAKIYNLKQAAKTLIYLNEQGIDSYDELVRKSATASSDFNGRLNRIKEIELRQKEISALQKQIGTYGKTKETYSKYIKSGRDQNFYEAERKDIVLHEAAKKHFDKLGYSKDKPLPKMDALKTEWATLEAEKKKLYSGYHELKSHSTELLTAKDNAERLLGINRNAPERATEHKNISRER